MSLTRIGAGLGALAGFGFGIYAASANFNPDGHQAESMSHSTRVFAELLFSIGTIGLYSGSLSFLAGVTGLIGDAATCCKFAGDLFEDNPKSNFCTCYGSI